MLIFALAAFGFTLLETTIYSSAGGLASIFRAFFPFRIMWQIFMGAHFYEYKVAKMNNDSKTMKRIGNSFCSSNINAWLLRLFNSTDWKGHVNLFNSGNT